MTQLPKSTTPSLCDTPPQEGNSGAMKICDEHTKEYLSLPYNAQLKERARALRRAGNLPEVLLWNQLKKGQFKGLV